MLHSYCEILAKAAANVFPDGSEVVSIARQNEKGIQILNEYYAGVDTESIRVGYIAFDGDDDLEFEKAVRQFNSAGDTYELKSNVKLVVWNKEGFTLNQAQKALQALKVAAKEFQLEPHSISTNTEKIFKEETGLEEGPRSEIHMGRVKFAISWDATLDECFEAGKEGCDGC